MKKNKKKYLTKKISKEGIFCIVIAMLVLVLLGFTIDNSVFMSALLISFALESFSICYYFKDDSTKKILIYSLFGLGIGFIIIALIYMIINTI